MPTNMGIVNQNNFQNMGMQYPNNNFLHDNMQQNRDTFQNPNYDKI